ncbi:unnamed protein product, partial [Allacma fusca]
MIVLNVWLLSGLILSNAYKGLMKTSILTGNELKTNWSELGQLKYFTLYLPADQVHTTECLNCTTESYNAPGEYCYQNGEFLDYKLPKGNIALKVNFSKEISVNQFRCVCMEDLDDIIEGTLTIPRTALVVPSEDFDYLWARVQSRMKEKKLRFSHNHLHTNDPLLLQPLSIYLEIGLDG